MQDDADTVLYVVRSTNPGTGRSCIDNGGPWPKEEAVRQASRLAMEESLGDSGRRVPRLQFTVEAAVIDGGEA